MDSRRSSKQLRGKLLLSCLLFLFICISAKGQNEIEDLSVPDIFFGTRVYDCQSTSTSPKGHLEIEILHRFGSIENGMKDMYGIYAPSNIAMGLNYGLSKTVDIQFNTEKNNKTQDLGLKYRFLKQSMNGSIPFSATYHFNLVVDGKDKEEFGKYYKFANRFIFSNQLLVSKQFMRKINLQAGCSFTHFNTVDSIYQSDFLEATLIAAYKITGSYAFYAGYQHPWVFTGFHNNTEATQTPNPGLFFGFEKASPGHSFQLFLSNRDNISIGKNLMHTSDNLALDKLRIGFNIRITVLKPKIPTN